VADEYCGEHPGKTLLTHYRTILYTSASLLAFAANSILCRMALGGSSIDAVSFSAIRLTSGAIALFVLVHIFRSQTTRRHCGNWTSASMLFLYVIAFSFAYLSLSAATGALILFSAVQITMMFGAIRSGETPGVIEWFGIIMALTGLTYLLLPGVSAPSPTGTVLMLTSGIALGIYSLRGKHAGNALANTEGNFIRTLPMIATVSLISIPWIHMHLSIKGVVLATLSGALASGAGYAIWYMALRGLTATRAAVIQLSVPVLTAIGSIMFLAEIISGRLILSSVMILGGIWLTISARHAEVGTKQY